MFTPRSTRLLAALCTAALAVLLTCGCETTSVTGLDADSGAYHQARAFLRPGFTTKDEAEAEFGTPHKVSRDAAEELWQYWRTETVTVSAFTGTGFDSEMDARRTPGYRQYRTRTTRMDLYFDAGGGLTRYQILRDVPRVE